MAMRYCVDVSCVGGEVTVLMESSRDEGRSARSEKEGAFSFEVSGLKFGFPVVGKGQGSRGLSPYRMEERICGCIGCGIGARKLEGELDVGGRRILRRHRGIHEPLRNQPGSGQRQAEVRPPIDSL
jgi:hypothetical protein